MRSRVLKGSVWRIIAFILTIALATPVAAERLDPSKRPAGEKKRWISHTAIQTPPIQLGTSGGWQSDIANGCCCGGTLGSLVEDSNGIQYILSNYHVFAGNRNHTDKFWSKIAERIIQPGLIDVSCDGSSAQIVAQLSSWSDPFSNNIDAAIAEVSSNMVSKEGAILKIGTISNVTMPPSLALRIKKSGRTTGLTRSEITGLDGTIFVSYDDECRGNPIGTARLTGQIVISNRGGKFIAGGDSGSLLVEDAFFNPRAIGLLFAGSFSVAIANPIEDVLDYFSVNMVGTPGIQGAELPVAVIENAKKVKAHNAMRFERVPRAVGHGIGLDRKNRVVIKVYVEEDTPEVRAAVPDSVDGIPVEIDETGRIVALSVCQ